MTTLIIIIAVAAWIFFYLILTTLGSRKRRTQKRLEAFVEKSEDRNIESVPEPSINERIIRPIMNTLYSSVERISPKGLLSQTESRLKQVGYGGPNAVQQWIALRVVLGGILPVLISLMVLRFGMDPLRATLVGIMPMAIVQASMSFYLIQSVQRRKVSIEKQLPDVLDIITVSVEAGLSFDGALERVVQKMESQLSTELGTMMKEMRMGKQRRQALKDFSDRCQVTDVTTWVGAMIQADELGVGIGNVLRVQSVQMREKRRQRAREKSMKAPIKMMFPLVFFIFPTIFVVLLGPAVIKVMETLFK